MKIDIVNLKPVKPLLSPRRIKALLQKILNKECNLRTFKALSLVFTDDECIRELNLRYLGRNYPTDVLAFNLGEIAELVICVDVAIRNARIYHTSPKKEIYLYIIHGMLHLLGYVHTDAKRLKLMRRKERQLLKSCTFLR